jgi:ribonucleoside-triphosphate reductase
VYIQFSYDQEFNNLWFHLQEKYPKKLFDIDGVGKQLDLCQYSKNFFSTKTTTADMSVDANANVSDMSVIAYDHEMPKPFARLNSYYILWKYLRQLFDIKTANEAVEKQLIGEIYINDFHGIGAGKPYCFNYSTYDVLLNGLPMVDKIKSYPPKYLLSFKSQLEQFIVIAANSTLGATGIADLFITMSYYVKNILNNLCDGHFSFKTYEDAWNYIKEQLVSFIYTVNQPLRSHQSPFSNVSIFDKPFLESLCENYIFPDASSPDIEIIEKLQVLYLDIMNEELTRTPVTFPITTACFCVDENKNIIDQDFVKLIAAKNQKFGFINIYCGSSSTLSSCCRLRSDINNEYFNSFGSGSSKIGSLGVCTVNLPRLAIMANKDKNKFIELLTNDIDLCAKINHAKRYVVKKRIDNGNHPLYKLGFMELDKQYSTAGLIGLYEALKFLGYDILMAEGQEIAVETIAAINKENDINSKKYKTPHNTEMIPGESVAYKLPMKCQLLKYQEEVELYSNQFIPLIVNADMLDRIQLQGLFDAHFSGGAIAHINVEKPIKSVEQIENLINTCAQKGVIYWAINYNLQLCENNHMTAGIIPFCEHCNGAIVDNFTRVVGFLTNIKNWNEARRSKDYPHREWYHI